MIVPIKILKFITVVSHLGSLWEHIGLIILVTIDMKVCKERHINSPENSCPGLFQTVGECNGVRGCVFSNTFTYLCWYILVVNFISQLIKYHIIHNKVWFVPPVAEIVSAVKIVEIPFNWKIKVFVLIEDCPQALISAAFFGFNSTNIALLLFLSAVIKIFKNIVEMIWFCFKRENLNSNIKNNEDNNNKLDNI